MIDETSPQDETEILEEEMRLAAERSATEPRGSFADYWKDANTWITLASDKYYPDILTDACAL